MKKYKRIIKKLLAISLILSMIPVSSFAYDPKYPNYNKTTNAREWSVTSAKATTGTTFTTLAFKAKIIANDKYYEAYIKRMDNPDRREYDDGKNITSYFMSYISTIGMAPEKQNQPNFYASFCKQAVKTPQDQKNIDEYFAGTKGSERMMLLDSVVVLNHNGVAQGSVTDEGIPIKTKNSKVFDTQNGFLNAAGWGQDTKNKALEEGNMYNIQVPFPAQPATDPTAVITRGTSETPTTYEVFNKGELVDLVGRKSFFPENVKKEYIWNYKPQNSTTWLDGGTNVTLNVKDLPIGTYDVKLHTQYHMICGWLKEPYLAESDPDAKAVIKIIKNDEIKSNTTVTSPEEMEIGETDTYANVPVNMKSTLDGVDLKNVKKVEYVLTTPEEDIVYSSTLAPTLTVNIDKTFKIPYKGSPFTQSFKGRVIYTLQDGEMRGNDNWAYSSTYIYQKGTGNEPPIPILAPIPDLVVGNDLRLNGSSSFDTDGRVVSWNFSIPQWGWGYDEEGKSSVSKTALATGTRVQAILGVTDDDGAYAETEQFFNVTPPPPMLDIDVSGTLKENRKVTLHSNVSNLMNYTTSEEQVTWKIKPYDGQDASVIKAKTLKGKNIDTLFKKLGSYYVECTAFNSAGMSSTQSMIIKISEDLKPEVVVSSFDSYYRDSEKKVGMTFFDNSESIDGDYITERSWYYAFDKDNDGSFSDETLTFLKTTILPDDNKLEMTVDHVGKYRIYLRVKEGFGQETIPEFVTSGDYKINNGEKIVEVDNHNPIVSFYPKTEKKVDLVVVTDYTGDKFNQLGTRLNEYVGESFDSYINVKLMMNSDSKLVGRFVNEDVVNWTPVTDSSLSKYEVAKWNIGNGLMEYSDNSCTGSFTTKGVYAGNRTITYTHTFNSRIKQVGQIDNLEAILLENGDLYVLGYNSQDNRGYSYVSDYLQTPTKIYSGIKSIVPSQDTYMMFLVAENGDVYVAGEAPYYPKVNASFTNYNNYIDLRTIAPSYNDNNSTSKFNGYATATRLGTKNGFSKVTDLSNIDYLKPSVGNIVARDKTGTWWGIGTSLNAFGHNTGFEDLTINTYSNAAESTALWYSGGWKSYDVYIDAINHFVKLDNLSNLDMTVGGIIDVEPQKAYTSSGNIYQFKQTPHVEHGSDGWENLYPFKLLDGGLFTSSNIGKGSPSKVKALSTDVTPSTIFADYAPSEVLDEKMNAYNLQTSWTSPETITSTTSTPAATPAKKYKYDTVPAYVTLGQINDFLRFSYVAEGTLASSVTGSYTRKGETYYTRTSIYNYKIVGYKSEAMSTLVVGWKFYGTDLSKLKNTTFRPNSEKYILYLGEKDSFQKISPDISDYIRANNIKVRVATQPKFVDRVTNKSVEMNLRDLLSATPNGKLYGADGLESMLSDITEENKNFVEGQDGLYLIKGENDVTYNSYFSDLESDTKINEIYNHLHNSTYFENGEGQSVYHDVKRNAPVTVFDKVGLYNVFYRATDQPTTEAQFKNYNRDSNTDELKVYVHRRPIAQMKLQYCNYAPFSMTVTDRVSYDLDHQSQSTRGIQEVEWQYRKGSDKTWQTQKGPLGTSIKIDNIPKGEKVLVYYRVKDLEGAWSKPVMEEVTPEVRLLMDASLISEKPENKLTAFPTGNHVIFKDLWSSYPYSHHLEIQMYDGNTPLLSKVVLTKEKGNVKTETPYPERTWKDVPFYIPQTVNGKLLEDKTYTFVVKALDSEDPAITAEKRFNVTTISNRPPTVDFTQLTPSPLYEGDQQEVSLKVDDPDKDLLKLDVYLKYDEKPEILYQSFTNLASGQTVALKPLTVEKGEALQWRGVVTDPKGEWAESKKVVPIEAFGIDSISVKGAWQHWRGQVNAFGQQMTNEPNRFLSMEKVTFSVNTRGTVNKVSLKLSPELEAMTYQDSKGHVYYYKDEVGYDVKFPLAMKLRSKDLYEITYILPFADSTQSWENKRLKNPYRMMVTIENAERKRTLVYGDEPGETKIDITGNIFDLLYNQPAKLKK